MDRPSSWPQGRAVAVEERIAATVDRVWRLVSDIELLPRFSDELQRLAET